MLTILPYFIFNHIIFQCIIRVRRCISMLHSFLSLFFHPLSATHFSLTPMSFSSSSPKALPLSPGKVALVRETSPAWSGLLLYSVVVFLDCALNDTVGYPLLHYSSLPCLYLSLWSSSFFINPLSTSFSFTHTYQNQNPSHPQSILLYLFTEVKWFIRSLFCEHTLCMLVLIKKSK